MTLYREALAVIGAVPRNESIERVPLERSVGRVLADDLAALIASPAFTNSAMDGYAFRHTEGSDSLKVTSTILASQNAEAPATGEPGTCVRIMTGAPLPAWADTVVQVEHTTTLSDGRIRIERLPPPRSHVRVQGDDFSHGTVLIHRNALITPERLLVAAGAGHAALPVWTMPRVAVLSTGDELIEPGTKPGPGSVINSSKYFLHAALQAFAFSDIHHETLRDDVDLAERRVHELTAGSSPRPWLIISTGAVSAGDKDFIPELSSRLELQPFFHRVDIRPGRPVFLAHKPGIVWLGLPGNPVSTAVGWYFFARPLLSRLCGIPLPRHVRLPLLHDTRKADGLRCFYRAIIRDGKADVLARQGSGELRPTADANAFVELPEDGDRVAAGTIVDVIPFESCAG